MLHSDHRSGANLRSLWLSPWDVAIRPIRERPFLLGCMPGLKICCSCAPLRFVWIDFSDLFRLCLQREFVAGLLGSSHKYKPFGVATMLWLVVAQFVGASTCARLGLNT